MLSNGKPQPQKHTSLLTGTIADGHHHFGTHQWHETTDPVSERSLHGLCFRFYLLWISNGMHLLVSREPVQGAKKEFGLGMLMERGKFISVEGSFKLIRIQVHTYAEADLASMGTSFLGLNSVLRISYLAQFRDND